LGEILVYDGIGSGVEKIACFPYPMEMGSRSFIGNQSGALAIAAPPAHPDELR
jgi:hypothetical protein